MGAVYRATDTKLGRDVALKVLPAEMARDPERLARFQREARVVAALNHPHIVTIFSVEEADGVHFLTMELVEGQPLDRCVPEGGLPFARIAEIAMALADALSAAHEKGIVHRDLKPANVMVTDDGRVKVLDFGLAKETRAATSGDTDATLTSAGHTEAGIVMGTPAYMSPEQVAGRAVDHRTDIFSLGILLYEMATGRRPFQGSSSAELASSILRDSPPTITDARGDLPSDLARIIRRCLEKDPRHRVQTARDVSNEFRDLARQSSQTSAVLDSTRSSARSSAGSSAADASGAARADEGFWVAVLPFKYTGPNADLVALAEGLTEEIVTGLSRFSYLRVIARSSTARFKSEAVDVRAAGKELGARYVMEGSLRQAGTRLRIAVQLVDASTGAHLWAETYDRPFHPEEIFALQDDVVPRIVATVADMHGVLPHTMSEALRSKSPGQLSPYEAVLRSCGYFERVTPEVHAEARADLEMAVQKAPGNADCWAMLALLCAQEYGHGFNVQPDTLGRAFAAARRAVELAPSNHLAHYALAHVLFFRKEFQAFRNAAERAIALNPMDGDTTAHLAIFMAYAGDWERGCALTERTRSRNPQHPGWYWFVDFYNAYRKGDYLGALDAALQINIPGYWGTHLALAAAYGQLGERDAAGKALRELLTQKPGIAATAREDLRKWLSPQLVEQVIEGLRKAGLEIAPEKGAAAAPAAATEPAGASARETSGAVRADEGFWVAVLPFKYTGANADLTALAEGLSEEIVTGLSRFSYLKVIARSSTARFKSEAVDVRSAGKELGARFVMEGSLRQAGSTLRISVQLVDASSGAHLWAETYDRPFRPEEIFALQDDLVPRIVSTVADWYGVLPHTMSEALRSKGPDQLSPYEAVLRSFGYFERDTAEEHAAARAGLERAVQQAPGHADCWAMLSSIYVEEYSKCFNAQPDPLGRALQAARRAAAAAPSNPLAYNALALALFFRKEFHAFRNAAERAIALNPMDGFTVAYMGILLAYAGDWEHGCALVGRALQLNPHHPGWFWFGPFFNAYRKGDYRGALEFALKINMPGYFFAQAVLVAAYGQLGEREPGRNALRELLTLRPDFAAREEFGKWLDPELVEHFVEGLGKAGLEIAPEKGAAAPAPAADTTGRPEVAVVVVLPFVNSSPDAGNEYFSDGLTEEIITDLSRIEALRVISRNSSMALKGATRDTASIAKQLGVTHVVSGSVRRAGDALRVTAELIEANSDAPLWSERYSGTVADVFGIQEEIARKIVAALKVRLTDSGEQRVASRPIENVVAYDCYLRARQEIYNWVPAAQERANRLVDQALGIVGENPLLLATKGQISWNKVNAMFDPDERHLDQAADYARRALSLDPQDHLGLFLRGLVAGVRGETASALRDIHRAHQLRPGDPNVLAEMCRFAESAGVEDGDYVKELVAIDPLTPVTWILVSFNNTMKGRFQEGLPGARRIIELAPGVSHLHIFAALTFASAGLRDEALDLLEMVGKKLAGTLHGSWALFLKYALEGDADQCCAQMTPLLERGAALQEHVARTIADGYSLIGRTDDALRWIRIGMNRGFINYPFLAAYDPLLANVRSDPRFQELMREVKVKWEALAQNLPPPLRAVTPSRELP